jgi:CBS domain-containing protein
MITAPGIAALTVADIMENRVATVSLDSPLAEVARLLWEEEISGAPVLDEQGHLAGFVSSSDIVRFKAYGAGPLVGRTVRVRPTTTVPALARFLVNAGIHRALVVDQGRLLGIVSAFDIVEAVAAHFDGGDGDTA